jgi:hypothetical protein
MEFEITLTHRGSELFFRKIEGNSLVEVLSKLNLAIAQLGQQLKEQAIEAERMKNYVETDDIPF